MIDELHEPTVLACFDHSEAARPIKAYIEICGRCGNLRAELKTIGVRRTKEGAEMYPFLSWTAWSGPCREIKNGQSTHTES